MDHLDGFCIDWAKWDDMLAFVGEPGEEFVESNLQSVTLSDVRIDAIEVLNREGRTVWAANRVPGENAHRAGWGGGALELPSPAEWREIELAGGDRKGLLRCGDSLMFVCTHPITSTSGEGPAGGTLVMGRYLDEALSGQLRELTQVDFHLDLFDDRSGGKRIAGMLARLVEQADRIERLPEQSGMTGYGRIDDLIGRPLGIIETKLPAEVAIQTDRSRHLAIALHLLAGLVVIVLIHLVLHRNVTRPVNALQGAVRTMRKEGDLTQGFPRTLALSSAGWRVRSTRC